MEEGHRGYPTDRLAFMVESTGLEISVTLLVSGMVITGILCPVARYVRWQNEVMNRAARGGGKFSGSALMQPPTPEQTQEIAEKWQARDLPDEGPIAFPEICVRNAEIQSGHAMTWRKHPYLLIAAAQIGAVVPGVLEGEVLAGGAGDQ
jgi:hypothetical protein